MSNMIFRLQSSFVVVVQVIAASCDSKFTHLAWVNTPRSEGGLGDMKIPIVADFSKKVATDYGVLLPGGIPLRALFIIDPKGTLRHDNCCIKYIRQCDIEIHTSSYAVNVINLSGK